MSPYDEYTDIEEELAAANALLRRTHPYLTELYPDEAVDDEQLAAWCCYNNEVAKLRDDIRKHLEEVE